MLDPSLAGSPQQQTPDTECTAPTSQEWEHPDYPGQIVIQKVNSIMLLCILFQHYLTTVNEEKVSWASLQNIEIVMLTYHSVIHLIILNLAMLKIFPWTCSMMFNFWDKMYSWSLYQFYVFELWFNLNFKNECRFWESF